MITLRSRNYSVIYAWIITLCFGFVYCSISIYNHYVFRTAAFDLGIKNQTLWDYAHFRYNYNTILPELHGEINNLANHFEPILFLFSPIYWIFGSYTLLVVQIVFILLGGWGIYTYFKIIQQNNVLPLFAMATFYAMWGVFAALSYDFHTNVIAAMLIPWLMVYFEKEKIIKAFIVFILIICCKENMALWGVFIGIGLAIHYKGYKKRWISALLFSGFSSLCFVLIMKLIMPYYAEGKLEYMHFSYSALGSDMTESLKTIVTRPGYVVRLLFENHMQADGYDTNLKLYTHWFVFLSGGIFLLIKPQFLIMLIPIYAQKMFSDDPIKWSVYNQYSIEFVPILVLAAFTFFSLAKDHRIRIFAGALLFLSAFDTTKSFLDMWQPTPYYKRINKFYSREHYHRELPVSHFHHILKEKIPQNASVSATYYLVPHLAFRKKIYQYPDVRYAEYVVWANDGLGSYPLDSMKYHSFLEELKSNGEWISIHDESQLQILKRVHGLE